MKTFEERFTAWTDGQLEGEELTAFEHELLDHEDAMTHRSEAVKLGALLREHGVAPKLTNQDFFNHSLMERIYAERPTTPLGPGEPAEQDTWWGLPKLVWLGAACLVASMIILPIIVPTPGEPRSVKQEVEAQPGVEAQDPDEAEAGDAYMAEVLEANPGDPSVSAVSFHSPDNTMTVVWLDGLDYIPASNQITSSNRAN